MGLAHLEIYLLEASSHAVGKLVPDSNSDKPDGKGPWRVRGHLENSSPSHGPS